MNEICPFVGCRKPSAKHGSLVMALEKYGFQGLSIDFGFCSEHVAAFAYGAALRHGLLPAGAETRLTSSRQEPAKHYAADPAGRAARLRAIEEDLSRLSYQERQAQAKREEIYQAKKELDLAAKLQAENAPASDRFKRFAWLQKIGVDPSKFSW